jgi:hypothetical protein
MTPSSSLIFRERSYNIIKSEIGEKYNQGRMRKINLFRSSTLRSSVQTTAAASATVMPEPQAFAVSAASDNSRAASAAVAELTAGLGFVFNTLDDGPFFPPSKNPVISCMASLLHSLTAWPTDEGGDLLQFHLEKLGEEAAKYQYNSITDGMGGPWSW